MNITDHCLQGIHQNYKRLHPSRSRSLQDPRHRRPTLQLRLRLRRRLNPNTRPLHAHLRPRKGRDRKSPSRHTERQPKNLPLVVHPPGLRRRRQARRGQVLHTGAGAHVGRDADVAGTAHQDLLQGRVEPHASSGHVHDGDCDGEVGGADAGWWIWGREGRGVSYTSECCV